MIQETSSIFEIVTWAGAVVSIIGLIGIIWCIVRVSRARRSNLDDESMNSVLQSVLPMNLGALFLSVLGLMMVVVGITLS